MNPQFFVPEDLSFAQVKVLTHAMFAVAKAEGVHDQEMRLIREFYESCTRAGDPPLDQVAGGSFNIADAKPLFDTPELAKMFTKSMLLLAYADGRYAQVEDDLVRAYARGLGLEDQEVDQLLEATREYLMQSLAHVQNLEALRDVQKRLEGS